MGRKDNENQLKDSQDLVKRLDELERVVKALLKGFKALEEESGDEHMPEGEYYAVKFE